MAKYSFSCVMGWVALALIGAWCWYVFTVLNPPSFNYQDTYLPARHFAGLLEFPDGSIHQTIYGGLPLLIPQVLAVVYRATGISLEALHVGLAVSSILAGGLGVYFWAARLAGNPLAGIVALLALPCSMIMAEVAGYSAGFWLGYLTLGTMAMGWLVGLWCLWMLVPADKGWRTALLYMLSGVLMLLHSTYAVIFLLAFGIGELLRLWRTEVQWRVWCVQQLVGGLLFLAVSFPQLQAYAAYFQKPDTPLDEPLWWTLMEFRKAFHVYLWNSDSESYVQAFVAAGVGMVVLLRQEVRTAQHFQLSATMIAVGVCCILSYVAVVSYPSPGIAGLVLTRSMVMATTLVLTAAAALPWLVQERAPVWGALAFVLLLLISAPVGVNGEASWPHYVLLWVVVALVAGPYVQKLSPRLMACMAFAIVALWIPAKKDMLKKIKKANRAVHSKQWDGVTAWMETTPKDALFLVPPYPYSNGAGARAHILDYALTGFSIYIHAALPVEVKALQQVYGLDLAAYEPETIRKQITAEGGILCLFEGRYLQAVQHKERLVAIKQAYPELDYVISFQPGVKPLEWSCKTSDAPLLDLPVAYANDHYVVYEVKDIH